MGEKVPWVHLEPELEIEVAEKNLTRFKDKVRELWKSCQSLTSAELRDNWRAYVRGWWGYHRLAENRRPVFDLEGWIRRHIRACFWERWHDAKGRQRHLQELGIKGRLLKMAKSTVGTWSMARNPSLHKALSNVRLKRHGFLMPFRSRGLNAARFNRRMRKTARPVVWEG